MSLNSIILLGDIVRPVDSDSGFDSCSHPTTSGRLSVLSYQSDLPPTTTSISIPDGQRDGGNERGTQVCSIYTLLPFYKTYTIIIRSDLMIMWILFTKTTIIVDRMMMMMTLKH